MAFASALRRGVLTPSSTLPFKFTSTPLNSALAASNFFTSIRLKSTLTSPESSVGGENQNKLPGEQVVPESTDFPPSSLDRVFWEGRAAIRGWPEVLGLQAKEAEQIIKRDMPSAWVEVLPLYGFRTLNLCYGRVRLYVDSTGKVCKIPITG